MPYITPENAPTEYLQWRILLPNDERFLAAILGQITELTQNWNWEQTTGISIENTVQLAFDAYDTFERATGMIGSIVHYATTNPPPNILACDGTQHLRTDYPELYNALLPSYIIDADNFVTPTIEDIFLLSAGTSHTVQSTGGEESHTLTVGEMPSHQHTYDKETYNVDVESVGVPDPTGVGLPALSTLTSAVGGDNPHNNMPPFIAFKCGIVAK